MQEEGKKNIFDNIETNEVPSNNVKEAVFSEIEIIQNVGHILDLFLGKYISVFVEALSPSKINNDNNN